MKSASRVRDGRRCSDDLINYHQDIYYLLIREYSKVRTHGAGRQCQRFLEKGPATSL
jgi:hypothetical protein